MKFIIKHEIPGRIRVHMVQPKMTFEEADILLYYLVNLENVTKAKVYERTQDAVIYYEKDRREIIKALQKFGYDRVTVPEGLTEHSGRQMNAEYQEKLLMKVVMRFGGKLLIPAPVRAVWTGVRSLKYLQQGIASLKKDGSDRSRVQSTVSWNDIYVYVGDDSAKMVDELTPLEDEIVVNKTTDSVSLRTNYTQILHNMGIDTVIVTGVVTDQCVASTIRVLADQGFRVICPEDSCAAATQELHEAELRIMNVIYCTVLSTDETIQLIEEAAAQGTPAID